MGINFFSDINKERQKQFIYIVIILIINIITFSNIFNNEFVSYDDPGYITENPLIRDLSFWGIKTMFIESVKGCYHPLTVIVEAVMFFFFKLNPLPYHVLNLVLHLINVILVYKLILLITKRNETAALVSIFFGIHPMHAETVNWVSDLKDILYTLFYIASLIYYIKFITNKTQDARHKTQDSKHEKDRKLITFNKFPNFQIFKFPNFQIFKFPNFQIFKFPNFQISKFSNFINIFYFIATFQTFCCFTSSCFIFT